MTKIMEDKVLDILRRVLETDNIDYTCSQDSCEQWDSLRHLNLIVELESEFDVEFEPEEIAKMKSFNEILKVLKAK